MDRRYSSARGRRSVDRPRAIANSMSAERRSQECVKGGAVKRRMRFGCQDDENRRRRRGGEKHGLPLPWNQTPPLLAQLRRLRQLRHAENLAVKGPRVIFATTRHRELDVIDAFNHQGALVRSKHQDASKGLNIILLSRSTSWMTSIMHCAEAPGCDERFEDDRKSLMRETNAARAGPFEAGDGRDEMCLRGGDERNVKGQRGIEAEWLGLCGVADRLLGRTTNRATVRRRASSSSRQSYRSSLSR